jgi:molybdopterin synthase catalytic subunit
MSIIARLEEHRVRPEQELLELLKQAAGDGGVVSFVGLARPVSKSGNPIDCLVLDHHPTMTQRSLDEIARAAGERFDVGHVRIVHRCGTVAAGEPIVFAGAASPHRRAAFEAADYLMDQLKTKAVLWKREVGRAGSEWIEPTDADYSDLERWS